MQEGQVEPCTDSEAAMPFLLNVNLGKEGKRGPQTQHTRDFSYESSQGGYPASGADVSASEDEDSLNELGKKGRRRTLDRVSRALSPYVSIPHLTHKRTPSTATASSNEEYQTPSESAVAAEPQGLFGVRDAIRRKLSLRRRRSSSIGGASATLTRPADELTDSESSKYGDEFHDDIAHLMEFSEKTNREIHRLFPQLPAGEVHVDDYTCAIQKEILIQGRLYLTSGHICFSANIFGYITSIVIPYADVVSIEKRSVLLIPNALQISTRDKQYFFASFVKRDAAYLKLHTLLHAAKKAESEKIAGEISTDESEKAVPISVDAIEATAVAMPASAEAHVQVDELAATSNWNLLMIAIILVTAWSVVAIFSCGALMWKVKGVIEAVEALAGALEVLNQPST